MEKEKGEIVEGRVEDCMQRSGLELASGDDWR